MDLENRVLYGFNNWKLKLLGPYKIRHEDKSKYDAVMSALAGVIYREMRSKKTVDYRKIERDEQEQMVAEEPVKYGE